ncbi:hypothetical protein CN918_32625 [Priestia megaterium]|nr:hypothetical protein CN918_32625 [Priestia megaterium]
MNVKIYLYQNKKSTIDIQSSLNYHEEKERNGIVIEDVYKGKLVWSITEKGNNGKVIFEEGRKKYLKALMDKSTAKILFHSILNDIFIGRFGVKGMSIYGGTEHKEDIVLNKTISVKTILNEESDTIAYYIVSILEEESVAKSESSKNTTQDKFIVQSWLTYEEALKMSIEALHFIQTEEIKYALEGKPLYTIMYGREGKPIEVAEVPKKEQKDKREITDEEYLIPLKGPFQGKSLRELSDKELSMIMNKAQLSTNEIIQELYKHAASEAKKRMGSAL